jgi:hypothetical protein
MTMKTRQLLDWESGILNKGEETAMFEELVDSGELGELPAKYKRRADELRAAGMIEDEDAG